MTLFEARPIFAAGDIYEVNDIQFRIIHGRKGPDDLRLDVLTQNGWRAVKMELSFFLADFHGQVEDVLYPPSKGKRGGAYFLDRVKMAMRSGYKHAQAVLETERYLSRHTPSQPSLPYDWVAEGDFDHQA